MAKSSCGDDPIGFDTSARKGPRATRPGSNHLRSAIMPLLPAVNDVVAAHRADSVRCRCAFVDRRNCPTLGLAAAPLDLVIRCWRLTRSKEGQSVGPAPRDLRLAVESRQLADSEAAALEEILGVLDLAAAHAEDAGMSLPMLAGIAVAVVDSYRAIAVLDTETASR
jgi:hypothetical protein